MWLGLFVTLGSILSNGEVGLSKVFISWVYILTFGRLRWGPLGGSAHTSTVISNPQYTCAVLSIYYRLPNGHTRQQWRPSLWPSGIGSRLGRNRLWVRFLAVSDIYPMFIEPTITWVPSGFSGYIWLDTKIVLKEMLDKDSLSCFSLEFFSDHKNYRAISCMSVKKLSW